jgi:hypothetical protein
MLHLSVLAAPPVPAGAAVRMEQVPMQVSDNGVQNVLPFFRWLETGMETGHGIGPTPDFSAMPAQPLADELPDALFDGFMEDTRARYLPWTMLDHWSTEQTDQKPELAILENEHLRVEVAPMWGGQVQRVLHKKTGRDLLLNNPKGHFLTDGGVLRIATANAIQWNWSPGLIGCNDGGHLRWRLRALLFVPRRG